MENYPNFLASSSGQVNIAAPVGRGCNNLPEDVRKVQALLNEHRPTPLRPLVVNGQCGHETIAAIEEFQRQVVRMHRPDGKCAPQGDTFNALSPVALTRAPELLVPYRPGFGLYVKTSGSSTLFGTPKTIASIENLARKVSEGLGANLGIVEISLAEGGHLKPHKSHRRGIDVDIRPLRKDKKNEAVEITDTAAYSHELTRAMVGYIREDPNVQFILFNDTHITGVKWARGHHNHLHVRFKE